MRPRLEALEDRHCPSVTFGGGHVLAAARIQVVLYGAGWEDTGHSRALAQYAAGALADLARSPWYGVLGAAGYGVGPAEVLPPALLDAPPNGRGWLDDSLVRAELSAHAGRDLAPAAPDALYVVFVEPGVAVSGASGNSQSTFTGYHSAARPGLYYCVVACPGPVAGSPWPNLRTRPDDLEQLTLLASHELAEAVTDPLPYTGWCDRTRGQEVADLAADYVYGYRGQVVQPVAGRDGLPLYAPDSGLPPGGG